MPQASGSGGGATKEKYQIAWGASLDSNGTEYMAEINNTPGFQQAASAKDPLGSHLITRKGVIKSLMAHEQNLQAPGQTCVCTIMKNGAATTLTATLDSTHADAIDATHLIPVDIGDYISCACTTSLLYNGDIVKAAVEFEET